MGRLFKHRWTSANGEAKNEHGEYTEDFNDWLDVVKKLTIDEITVGFKKLIDEIEQKASQGQTMFPPTPLEFAGRCKPNRCPNGINSQAYAIRERVEQIEDLTQNEKNHDSGDNELSKMASMFNIKRKPKGEI